MGSKYIKNTENATLVCRLASDKNRVFIFPNKKFDKVSNTIKSNGYTEISEEDIKLLQEQSKSFNYYIEKGGLSIVDNMPYDSMNADQLISVLKAENAELKKMLKEAQKGDSTAFNELVDKVSEQDKKISELKDKLKDTEETLVIAEEQLKEFSTKLKEKEAVIEALDVQLADIAAAKTAKKEAKKDKE